MNSFIIYAIESSMSLFLLFGLYYLVLRKQSHFLFNRIFLLISLLTSFVIPLIDFSFISNTALYHVQLDEVIIGNQIIQEQASSSFSILSLLYGIYFTIAGFLLLKFVWELFSVMNIKSKSTATIGEYNQEKIFINQNHNFSFFNWIFIKEEDKDSLPIIEHEMSHTKMLHSYDIVLIKTMQILFWFNPVLFLIERELRLQHEYAVDEKVLKQSKSIPNYQQLLLNQVFQVEFNLISNHFNQTFLKNRFIMMTKKENKKWSRLFLMAFLSMAFISPAFVSCTMDSAKEEANSEIEEVVVTAKTPKNVEAKEEIITEAPNIETKEDVFLVVENMPMFPGGEKAMYTYIAKNVTYPEKTKQAGIQGRVFIGFIVEKDGSITDVKIDRGVSPEIDQEAIRVIESMPNWKPGEQKGKPVRVQYRLPLKFTLN